MEARREVPDVPGCVRPVQQTIQHAIEAICTDPVFAVEALRAAPAENDIGRANIVRRAPRGIIREFGWQSGVAPLCRLAHFARSRASDRADAVEQIGAADPSIFVALPGERWTTLWCRGGAGRGLDRNQKIRRLRVPRLKNRRCDRCPSSPQARRCSHPRPARCSIPVPLRRSAAHQAHGRCPADNSERRARHISRLPANAPMKGRSRAGRRFGQLVALAPQLQRVVAAQIMINSIMEAGHIARENVGFGRMQIAARWIAAHRPAVGPVFLPGGERHGKLQ